MTKIVIAGAGFGGLNLALGLEKVFHSDNKTSITLIDRHDYHLFTPSLYEVATAEEEMTSVLQLEKSIALPITELLRNKRINFVQGEVGVIDQSRKKIKAGIRELDYDYLVLAMGSKTEYFGVEGAEKFSLPLKNLKDAFRVRNALEFAVQAHQNDAVKQYVRFVVAGGGYTGVELAAEMDKLADILAWKNNYPREKIEILVIESANSLVPGFDERAGRDIYERLSDLNIKIKLLSPIFKVDHQFVSLVSGERIPYDALIWTTGVRACDCEVSGQCTCNKRGQFETDEFLRVKGSHNVFALGDIACVHGPNDVVAPTTAQAAGLQAEYLAKALPKFLQNKKPAAFVPGKNPFIVSVGGKWALFKSDHFYFTGYLPYLLRIGANIRYFSKLPGLV